MNKYELLIVIAISIIPLLWYTPGYFFAKGDSFPYVFSSTNLYNDSYMWSANSLGNPSPNPAFVLYGFLLSFLNLITNSIGLTQVFFYSLCFFISTISIFYFIDTFYPNKKLIKIIASVFYIFNFFILQILWNIGMLVTYAFLPMLIAIFARILIREQRVIKLSICFGLLFTVAASISSMNPAHIVLILLALMFVFIYYVLIERRIAKKQILQNLTILLSITLLLNIWWIIPIFNYYLLSASTAFQSEINVLSWSFTHGRASFLNLFLLNANWAWLPEYYPFYNFFSETILVFFLSIPLLLASASLFFRSKKQKFNLYIFLVILLLIFLAKGLHEPLGFLNLFLYNNIPFMSMFREPVSKFTLVMIPLLALLVGFSTSKLAHKIDHLYVPKKKKFLSQLFPFGVILLLIISSFPMLTNPIEAKTEQIPFSSYIQLPDYYYDVADWLNEKDGVFNTLVTPLDAYYQVAYTWGYYGSDSFLERLISTPLISPCYDYFYRLNPNSSELINQVSNAIKLNDTQQFETLMDLLNVRYVLQRNDIDYDYLSTMDLYPLHSDKIKAFLDSYPKVKLVATFEKIDVYEYSNVLSYVNLLNYIPKQKYEIEFFMNNLFLAEWNFSSEDQLLDWTTHLLENQVANKSILTINNSKLVIDMSNSNQIWTTLSFPLISGMYGAETYLKFDIAGQNTREVHLKIFEYDENLNIVYSKYLDYIDDGTFDWKLVDLIYSPEIENTTFLQFQIWNNQNSDENKQNIFWLDDIIVKSSIRILNSTPIRNAFRQDSVAITGDILDFKKLNPTKISVVVSSAKPFMLILKEAYDPNWIAHVEGKIYNPIPIFSTMNGFQIDRSGKVEIMIEYGPQQTFEIGVIISIITLSLCIAYLSYKKIRTTRKRADLISNPL